MRFGVPTTRALAAVTTGDQVYRETALPGAVLTRIAASHLRVGTVLHAERRKLSVSLRITLLHATTQRRAMQINPT